VTSFGLVKRNDVPEKQQTRKSLPLPTSCPVLSRIEKRTRGGKELTHEAGPRRKMQRGSLIKKEQADGTKTPAAWTRNSLSSRRKGEETLSSGYFSLVNSSDPCEKKE
jgi:hypothetical protein